MSRWPPAVWLLVAIGSLLVLIGVGGDWNPAAFFSGAAAMVAGFVPALYLAYGRHRDRPSAGALNWLVGGTAIFYVACVALVALTGARYALAAAGASLIPLTAATLIIATARGSTRGTDGRRREAFGDGTLPGVGIDDATPLGDTDQHSDASA
jgi:hypothetical protein